MEFTPLLKSIRDLLPSAKLTKKSSVPLTVLILSPHPDDESIISSLPLRLLHENGAKVINVAVTLGSAEERKSARARELADACDVLKIESVILDENWTKKARELKDLILQARPALIIAPHVRDHHPTHVKTGELLKKVLDQLRTRGPYLIAWSEFWGQLPRPNVLVEVPEEVLELQMQALAKHVGEVSRNPYHLRLPAWMMDNVRRGSELVGGKGAKGRDMAYGILYHLQLFKQGTLRNVKLSKHFLTAETDLGQIFKLILDAAAGSSTKVK